MKIYKTVLRRELIDAVKVFSQVGDVDASQRECLERWILLEESGGRWKRIPVVSKHSSNGFANTFANFGIIDLACTIMKVERAEL